MEKEICNMILMSSTRNAKNIGITILDKYENTKTGVVPELIEIAFYVQRLTRALVSQQARADKCYQTVKYETIAFIGGD